MKVIEPPIADPREPLCVGEGPFRPNTAALILRNAGREILLGERFDAPGAWQWPQGGLDPGETPEAGLRREVAEEIGVGKLRILYRFPFKLRYRFPQRLATKFKPRIGQEQIYFIVELEEPPDLARAEHQEFGQLRWTSLERAIDSVIWFKREVSRLALEHTAQVAPGLHFQT